MNAVVAAGAVGGGKLEVGGAVFIVAGVEVDGAAAAERCSC